MAGTSRGCEEFGVAPRQVTTPIRTELEQAFELAVFEGLNDFGDVLGAFAGTHEERVGRFDDDEIFDTDGSDEFAGAPEKIAGGVEGKGSAGGNVVAGLGGEEV